MTDLISKIEALKLKDRTSLNPAVQDEVVNKVVEIIKNNNAQFTYEGTCGISPVYKCSNCKNTSYGGFGGVDFNYCPYCGRKIEA